MAREQLKNLTEPMYYILLSLTRQRHGYSIMQSVEEFTEGRVIVGAGTLYALLARFEGEGIIAQVEEVNRRKIYKLTEKGEALLMEEYRRLKQLVADGEKYFHQEGNILPPPGHGGGRLLPVGQTASEEDLQESGAVIQERKQPVAEPEKKEKKERRKSPFRPSAPVTTCAKALSMDKA